MAGTRHTIRAVWRIMCLMMILAGLAGCNEDEFRFVFDHKTHTRHTPVCLDCHNDDFEFVAKAGHPQCIQCHEITGDQPSEKCLLCHKTLEKQAVAQIEKPDYSGVEVGHETHYEAGVDCSACHGTVDTTEKLSGIRFIPMEGCVACHFPQTKDQRAIDCAFCHHEMDSRVEPATHEDAGWTQRHGNRSVTRPEYCSRCHLESGCRACHQSTMPRFHTIAFRKRGHGTWVSNTPEQCEVCHRQDFCVSCHVTTEPVTHTPVFKSSRPYTHCGMCHLPMSQANRCIVCHKSAPHNEARADAPPPPPYIPLDWPCFFCHPVDRVPVTHLYNTIPDTECTFCHGN